MRGLTLLAGSPLVLADDGSLAVAREGAWSLLAPPPPVAGLRVAGARDGSVWVAGPTWVQRWDREWGPREPVGDGRLDALCADASGRVWAGGLYGQLHERTASGWRARRDLPLAQGETDASIAALDCGGPGGVWVATIAGRLLRVSDGAVDEVPWPEHLAGRPSQRPHAATAGSGALWVGGDALLAFRRGRWSVESDRAVTALAAVEGEVWTLDPKGWGCRFAAAGESCAALPVAGTPRDVVATPAGRAWAVAGDRVLEARPGPAPAFREAPRALGLESAVLGHGSWVADFDGDGWEDVLHSDRRRGLSLLRQGPDGFVDATAAAGLGAGGPATVLGSAAVCDLDGNGDPDLIGATPASPGPARFRYLRNLGGRFQEVAVPYGADWPSPYDGRATAFTCADVDGRRGLDVLVAGEASSGGGARGVDLLVGDGWGRLLVAPLARRGLGSARDWVRRVLVADLEGDGAQDAVVLSAWSRGNRVLRGLPGGGFREWTAASGLGGAYGEPDQAWLVHLDGDPYLDLVAVDAYLGVRAWAGGPEARFEDRTSAWGVAGLRPGARDDHSLAALGDLDGDGDPDLLTCHPPDGCAARAWTGDRFEPWTGVLPAAPGRIDEVLLVDAGADGDADVLLARPGGAVLWEDLRVDGPRSPLPRTASAPLLSGVLRRVAWWDWRRDGLRAAVAVLGSALAFVLARAAGSRAVLGRARWAASAAAVGAGVAFGAVEAEAARAWAACGTAALLPVAGAAAEARAARRRAARTVAGYVLESQLGVGGMGTVHRARHLSTGVRVALKLVHPHLLRDADSRRRYRVEAEAASRVDDPRVVRIVEHGEWTPAGASAPTVWVAMELVDGVPLRAVMAPGPLPPPEVCSLGHQLGLALDAVHRARVVHRDVKPENVMVTRSGGVVLMDFSAAGVLETTTFGAGTSAAFTLAYAAPEQLSGAEVTPASDVYALGTLLYEAAAGARPFHADGAFALIRRIQQGRPPPLADRAPGVPPELSAWIERALDPDPTLRPPAADLAAALADLAGDGAVPRPALRPTATGRPGSGPLRARSSGRSEVRAPGDRGGGLGRGAERAVADLERELSRTDDPALRAELVQRVRRALARGDAETREPPPDEDDG